MLLQCCTQYVSTFGKASSGHRTGKGQFAFQSQRRTTTNKECSNYHTIALISHASKVMLKIPQWLGFNSTCTKNFQMYKLDFKKVEEPEIKLPTSIGSLEKAREFQQNIYFCFIDYAKAFDCVDHNSCGKFLWEYQTTIPTSLETCKQLKKQQLELVMEQWTGSKWGKEYVKAVYLDPDYLTLCRRHHAKCWAR